MRSQKGALCFTLSFFIFNILASFRVMIRQALPFFKFIKETTKRNLDS
jgi:hypothetical protein